MDSKLLSIALDTDTVSKFPFLPLAFNWRIPLVSLLQGKSAFPVGTGIQGRRRPYFWPPLSQKERVVKHSHYFPEVMTTQVFKTGAACSFFLGGRSFPANPPATATPSSPVPWLVELLPQPVEVSLTC